MNDDKADLFTQMADRIKAVADGEFAGAVLIVPPGDGEPVVLCNIEPNASAEHFWIAAKSRMDAAYVAFSEAKADPFGNRRR